MLIVTEGALRLLMSSVVSAARSARDHNGAVPVIKTVDEFVLRGAVLASLSIIAGQPVDTEIPRFERRDR